MATTQIKGRFISCWRQSDGYYHLTIADSDGAGEVIELSQVDMMHVMGGSSNGSYIDFSIKSIDAPAVTVAET